MRNVQTSPVELWSQISEYTHIVKALFVRWQSTYIAYALFLYAMRKSAFLFTSFLYYRYFEDLFVV